MFASRFVTDLLYQVPDVSGHLNVASIPKPTVNIWMPAVFAAVAAAEALAQVSPFGRETRFAYHPGNRTVVSDTEDGPVSIFEHDQSPADAGEDMNVCTPQNSVVMSANAPIFPATASWNIIPGSTGIISDLDDPNTTISGLIPGIHSFTWRIDNGPCIPGITTDTVQIHVFDTNLPDANAGPNDIARFLAGRLGEPSAVGVFLDLAQTDGHRVQNGGIDSLRHGTVQLRPETLDLVEERRGSRRQS